MARIAYDLFLILSFLVVEQYGSFYLIRLDVFPPVQLRSIPIRARYVSLRSIQIRSVVRAIPAHSAMLETMLLVLSAALVTIW